MSKPPDPASQALRPVSPEEAQAFVVRRMSLRHARVLLALAEGKGLSAAADALHVTQPAVSKALAEIEQGLGKTLFSRRDRGFRATALGRKLIALAGKMEADLTRGGEDVASMVRGASGELLIGATNAALAQVLPEAMVAMKAEHPNVTLSVRTHSLNGLFAELRSGQLDMVIARVGPHEMPPDLQGQCLIRQDEALAISAHHPLAGSAKRLSWETLCQQAWIWHLPNTRSRTLHDRLWQKMNLPLPSNVIETGDMMLALSLMRRMPLVSIMPQHVAKVAAANGVVVILPLDAKLGLADLTMWHVREPQNELVERFKQLLSAAARDLPD